MVLDFLSSAPSEVAIFILLNLHTSELARCERVSQSWRNIVQDAWRDIAIQNEWAKVSHKSVAEALDDPDTGLGLPSDHRIFKDMRSFKDLCRKRMSLDSAWKGENGNVKSKLIPWTPAERTISGDESWRIKIDPIEDTVIRTLRDEHGGLQVLDFQTHKMLWQFSDCASHSHLEFDQGYMIFNSDDEERGFTVLKAVQLCSDEEIQAHDEQFRPRIPTTRTRGSYISLGKLRCPHPIRAYKFNYPNLMAATWDKFVVTFDVPKMELISSFKCRKDYKVPLGENDIMFNHQEDGGEPIKFNYIDHDSEFVYLIGVNREVLVYDRETGRLLWNLDDYWTSRKPQSLACQWKNSRGLKPLCEFEEISLINNDQEIGWLEKQEERHFPYAWSAIHPDPKTGTLVVLGQTDILLLRDYKEFFRERKAQLDRNFNSASYSTFTLKPPSLFLNIRFDPTFEPDDDNHFHSQLTVQNGKAFLVAFAAAEWPSSNTLPEWNVANGFLAMIDLDPTSSPLGFKFHSSLTYHSEPFFINLFNTHREDDVDSSPSLAQAAIGSGILKDCSCLQMNGEGVLLAGFERLKLELLTYYKKGIRRNELDMVFLDFNEIAEKKRFNVNHNEFGDEELEMGGKEEWEALSERDMQVIEERRKVLEKMSMKRIEETEGKGEDVEMTS